MLKASSGDSGVTLDPIFEGCGFFAYSWKLPAYSGAFLLTVGNFSFFAYSFSFLTYSWSFFAYSGKVLLIRALRDCKQRSPTVSKKAPTVSKKASPIFESFSSHLGSLWGGTPGITLESLFIGHTPMGSYSRNGVLLPSRCLLQKPLLRTPSKNPSQNPSSH